MLIADGHHRYETACTYAAEVRARQRRHAGPYDLVLAFVVELSEEELSIRAIHRLVTGCPPGQLTELLASLFRIEPAPEDLWRCPPRRRPGSSGLLTRDGFWLLHPLPALAEAAEDDLDSSRLAVVLGGLADHELSYQPGWHEAVAAVRDGRADAAFLLAAGSGRQDRARRARRAPHAAEEHVLPAEAPHRHGLPVARGLSEQRPQS